MFGKKKAAAAELPKKNAAAYIVDQINRMAGSNNYMFVYGMIYLAYDFDLITIEERQALDSKCRDKANELLQKEKEEAARIREEKARKIAEYEAQRKEKAKAAKAKMKEEKK